LRDADQLIDFILTPVEEITGTNNLQDSASYFYAQNVAGFTTYGIDLQLRNTHELNETWKLMYSAGVLWVDFSEEIASKYVANSAGILVSAKAGLAFKGSSLNINVLHKEREAAQAEAISRELTTSYTLFNAALQVKLYKALSVKLNVMNALDICYADVLGAQMPGRWVMAGLRVDI
jgi:iron complex outermembrane receptor protein